MGYLPTLTFKSGQGLFKDFFKSFFKDLFKKIFKKKIFATFMYVFSRCALDGVGERRTK